MRHDEIYADDPPTLSVDMAWAIGLFEGEGCLTISHGRQRNGTAYVQPRLKLNSTDEDVVRRFHDVIEYGSVSVEKAQERRGWKRQWCWTCGARRDVAEVILRLLPYLGSRRAMRALEVLAALRRGDAHGSLTTPPERPRPTEVGLNPKSLPEIARTNF